MSKKTNARRKSARSRREAARKRQRQQGMIVAGVLLVALVGAVFFTIQGQQAADVPQARLELDPIMGNPDAPITLIEYGAYGCHACKQWHEFGVVEQLLAEFPDQVRFIYRDMPIIDPPYSQRAAEVAQCGLDQGNDAFWSLHDAIFVDARQGVASQDDLIALGGRAGLDESALADCVRAGTHTNTVRYDQQRGAQLGIRATPTWFVNDQRVFNASPDVLRNLIQQQLQALGIA